jgi:hypothetical protein
MLTVIAMADYLWSVDVEEEAVLVAFITFVKEGLHVGADSTLYRGISYPFPCLRWLWRLKRELHFLTQQRLTYGYDWGRVINGNSWEVRIIR